MYVKAYGFNEPQDGSLKIKSVCVPSDESKTRTCSFVISGLSLKEVKALLYRVIRKRSHICYHLYYYTSVWVKKKIVSFVNTANFFLHVLNTFMYKSVQLYTYPQFEHECSLCWNELKPVHSHNMIHVQYIIIFSLQHSIFSHCVHVNI